MSTDAAMQLDVSGNDNQWVKLTTSEGYDYLVKRKAALSSGYLKSMLSAESNFAEALSNTITTTERAIIVEKLAEYMTYKSFCQDAKKNEEIPDFQERIPPEISLELLVASDYFEL